mmetsp:Transcript_48571/g.101488  ORF Transcript_48571/g.101488 Transcript_48571/m.101488 type:complete len:200 (+) Transcript_48571:422-1021(+)
MDWRRLYIEGSARAGVHRLPGRLRHLQRGPPPPPRRQGRPRPARPPGPPLPGAHRRPAAAPGAPAQAAHPAAPPVHLLHQQRHRVGGGRAQDGDAGDGPEAVRGGGAGLPRQDARGARRHEQGRVPEALRAGGAVHARAVRGRGGPPQRARAGPLHRRRDRGGAAGAGAGRGRHPRRPRRVPRGGAGAVRRARGPADPG